MKQFLRLTVFSIVFLIGSHVSAQHEAVEEEHTNHLGIGFTATKLFESGELEPGFHLHYLHRIKNSERWAMGVGYEAILSEHIHNMVNYIVNFRPVHMISINAGPGAVFGKHDGEFEILPAFHTEAVLEFEINRIHLGPVAGYGFDSENSHFSFGVHVGLGF